MCDFPGRLGQARVQETERPRREARAQGGGRPALLTPALVCSPALRGNTGPAKQGRSRGRSGVPG